MAPVALRHGGLASRVPRDSFVLVSSCSAESALLRGEVAAAGEALGALDCSGVFVPGLNRSPWLAGPASRTTGFFQTPELRDLGARHRFLPLCYEDIVRFYRRERPAAALFMCAPPDDEGNCSFGTEVACIAALWPYIPVRIAHINPLMPRTAGHCGIPFSELTGFFEAPQALRATAAPGRDPVAVAIAAHVAGLVPDDATLQTGLGKVPDAVLAALVGHRGLRLHSGLVGDGALALVRSCAMAPGQSATVGVAIGSEELYAGLDNPHFQFQPVTITHDPATLAAIQRLVTINSAMQVDLFGQAYAEMAGDVFQSGPGGASDYARGARRSPGGLRIVALTATARGASRIVGPGEGQGPVSLSRFGIDCVVTEHGVADLRLKSHGERARALIAIAAPDHREALEIAWRNIARAIAED